MTKKNYNTATTCIPYAHTYIHTGTSTYGMDLMHKIYTQTRTSTAPNVGELGARAAKGTGAS